MKLSYYCLSIALVYGLIDFARIEPIFAQVAPLDSLQSAPLNESASTNALASTPLKPGDRLRITIVGFPDLSGEELIPSDGMIQMPLVGQINIVGLSTEAAVDKITKALLPYVRRPQVGLTILSLSPLRISVTGEVVRPGPQLLDAIKMDETDRQQGNSITLKVSDALVLAGGITPDADLQNIIIRRAIPQTSSLAGSAPSGQSEIKVNLWDAVRSGNLAANLQIYDGDEIFVPVAISTAVDQRALLSSTLAPTAITVQVAGEVVKPGQLQLSPTAGVSAAVAAAGGPTDKADTDSLELYRLSREGRLERQTFAFDQASMPLLNGDLIVVRKTGVSNTLDFLGRVVPLFNPFFFLF